MNTKFFHSYVTSRKRKKKEINLKDKEGTIVEDQEGIYKLTFDYYAGFVGGHYVVIMNKITSKVLNDNNCRPLCCYYVEVIGWSRYWDKKQLFA